MRKNSDLILSKLRFAPIVLAAVLSACSTSDDVSDKLRAQGSHLNEQADKWSKGQKMAQNGDALIAEGRDLVTEGYEKIDKGQKQAAEGHRMKQEVEIGYADQPKVKQN